jgi:cytochrome c553
MTRTTTLAAAIALALGAVTGAASAQTAAAPAGDPVKGRAKTQMCEGCHGIPGWRTAFPEVYTVPKLGGQHQGYLVAALKAYRSGDRSHPTMRSVASNLTDEDIANLAAYYARPGLQTASK